MKYWIFISLFAVVLFSCWPQQPQFCLSRDYSYVEDHKGSILREVEIKQYDSSGNFVASSIFHKLTESKGKNRIYIFEKNNGYSDYHLNKTFFSTNYVYKIKIQTLGFEDSLILKKGRSFSICN
jgi:hypothetical protein